MNEVYKGYSRQVFTDMLDVEMDDAPTIKKEKNIGNTNKLEV